VTCEAWCDGALARGPSAPGPIRDGPGPGNETTGHGHDRHWVCQGEHHRSGPFDSGSRAQGGRLPGHPAEKRSGTTTEGREALRTVLEFLHAGDVLMVTLIDRLARSIGDLHDIVRTVRTRGAVLKATDQPFDTGVAAGMCFLDMLGVFAEFETNLRRERQLEGIANGEGGGRLQGPATFDRGVTGARD
jgi:hypothetical protein